MANSHLRVVTPETDAYDPLEITPDVVIYLQGLLKGLEFGSVEIIIQDRHFFGFRRTESVRCPDELKPNKQMRRQVAAKHRSQPQPA